MANRMTMVTIVSPIAINGEISAIVFDRSARFSSTSCMRRFLVFKTASAHQQAEVFACRFRGQKWRRQAPMKYHRDAVGDFSQFVEILACHQHGRAAGCEVEQRLADHGGSAGIDAPSR